MKKFIMIISSLLFINNANAQDLYLRDFNDVIKQEESVSNFVYILERCAGLFASVGNRFISSGRSDSKGLGNQMMTIGTEFNLAAVNVAKTQNLNVTIESSMRKAVGIGKIYSGIMDDNHNRTGNALIGQVASDQNICLTIYKAIKGKK